MRLEAVPRIVAQLSKHHALRRYLFRTISQTLVHYRHSAWSEGRAGAVRGGDRLPWVKPEGETGGDNFAPLASIDWQVHVYGDAPEDLATVCARRSVPLHTFPWQPNTKLAGLAQNAAYLIRPDGYVALADPAASHDTLAGYLDRHGLRMA